MKFLSEKHHQSFRKLRQELASEYRNNKEYLSVVYILAGNEELERKMRPYLNMIEGSLYDDDFFKKEDLSGGLYVLAKLTVNLFNDNKNVNPIEIVSSLDEENFELAIEAIRFRRYGLPDAYNQDYKTHSLI